MDILDNPQILTQRDSENTLTVIAGEWKQVTLELEVHQQPQSVNPVDNVIVAGMGGSGLASDMAKDWLELTIPYEVVKDYDLPAYVNETSLVVASSFSGNTEETLSVLYQAITRKAQVVVIAKGGKLLEAAIAHGLPYIKLEWDYQPRMGMFINLNALARFFSYYGVIKTKYIEELASVASWLERETSAWLKEVPFAENDAKQIASWCAGKTPVIYAGNHIMSLAYKWKISFSENSKNTAFHNSYPEFNHNEFIGWTSHPIEKPFAIINLRSQFDHPRIAKRFELSERLLSGKRPAPKNIDLRGESRLEQLLWGAVLADFVSVYLGIINGVDPMKVKLIETFKTELGPFESKDKADE